MADTTNAHVDHAADFQEPPPQNTEHRRSSITKIFDAIKKPFISSSKKEKDVPPALQEAINKMEQRKLSTTKQMEEEGKSTKV